MPNLRSPKFLIAAVALATSMGRARGSQTVDDCAPVWVPPRTSDSSSPLRSLQATEAAVPTARQPEQTAAQADSGTVRETVLDGLRGRDQPATTLSNAWENSVTCGWVSGVSSYPWICADDWHCETNKGHAVGCVSGTYSPLYTECYDYTAWTNGLCDDTDSLTGCCESSQSPACVTYMWSGTPRRSMFRCDAVPAITSMLDIPQFVLDASLSASRASAMNTTTTSNTTIIPSPSGTTTATTETTTPTSTGDAAPAATPLHGLAVAGLVVLALLLVLGCAGCPLYLRWAHRRDRGDPNPAVELRDMQRHGDGGGAAEAGFSSGPRSAVRGVSATQPPPTDRRREGWVTQAWGRGKKAVGR